MNSTHKTEVVEINLRPHDNADSLSLVSVDGYTVVVKTDDWKDRKTGVYIPPDNMVDTERPEFAFLHKKNKWERITVKRLRGILSMGMLVPTPEGLNIGDDASTILDIQHYVSPDDMNMGDSCSGPSLTVFKYDVESYYKYLKLFNEGEPVFIQEKIHGANMRIVNSNNKIFVGSRTQWKSENKTNVFWRAYYNTPSLKRFCEENPDFVVYGECFGSVQNFKYNMPNNVGFVMFDISYKGTYLEVDKMLEFSSKYEIPLAPIISYNWPFNKEEVKSRAEGRSLIPGANHVREGCVVRPMQNRYYDNLGRLILKVVGEGYYNAK